MPASTYAKTFIGRLPVPIDFGHFEATHVEIRRQTGKERQENKRKADGAKGEAKDKIARLQMLQVVEHVGVFDEDKQTWDPEQTVDSLEISVLDNADVAVEDFIFEGMIAISLGYGDVEAWRASDDYKSVG